MLGKRCRVRSDGPYLGEANRVEENPEAEVGDVAGCQLSRQCRDNHFAVSGAFRAVNCLADSDADLELAAGCILAAIGERK